MSALAVFFEREAIATVVVGLVRLHLEKIAPPRALWVPFQLGRPLGAFSEAGNFQKRVLRAAFALLDKTDGPTILEDFTEEDPGDVADPHWQAPDSAGADSLVSEIQMLAPRWQQGCSRLGRTMVGLSGLPIEQAADYIARFDTDDPAVNPNDDFSDLLRLRFSADDVRTYMIEAALSEGSPSSQQIGEWLWSKTQVSSVFRHLREQNQDHEQAVRALIFGKMMVPGAWV